MIIRCYNQADDDDDEFRFNDASTHEGYLRQNGELTWFCNETIIMISHKGGWQVLTFYRYYEISKKLKQLGPVVQSIVSLTSSLRVISLTVLADSIYNILIFFAEKMWVAFALQKLLTFFQQKISAYLRITRLEF